MPGGPKGNLYEVIMSALQEVIRRSHERILGIFSDQGSRYFSDEILIFINLGERNFVLYPSCPLL